jgi:1-acyl-sn-glycerol-3-phosphate acyltransferase
LGVAFWCLYVVAHTFYQVLYRWRSNRRCPFPEQGAALIIANHRSPADPLLLWMNIHRIGQGMHIRRIIFMMAREYYEIPGVGALCRMLQAIPADRNGRDMGPARDALRRLQDGQLVGVFPEGRLNTGAGLLDASNGVAWLALRAKVPVYPVFIEDAPQSESMVAPFFLRCRTRVYYGDPIDLSEYSKQRKTQELLKNVTDLLMSRLGELGGVTYQPADNSIEQEKSNSDGQSLPLNPLKRDAS